MRLSFFILTVLFFQNTSAQSIVAGAERLDEYLGLLRNKKVAVACNASSRVGNSHLIDTLVAEGIQIHKIFAPEHGFRGDADAGAHIQSGIDDKTGIAIKSLYGENKKPSLSDYQGIDIVVFDIQDVGVRFYTYISTLQYIMEACAEYKVPLLILDRPNPNGHYVDGPVLEIKNKSFVGMQPIPIVYGMTIGEYAQMLIGEKWLNTKSTLDLKIISCQNYTHSSKVVLTTPPSPNLKSSQAIALYPSLCLMEGTDISVGRGTESPFEIFGSPYIDKSKMKDTFTPQSKKGATNPPFLGQKCFGMNLHKVHPKSQFDLSYILSSYRAWTKDKSSFFLKNLFFDKLAGNTTLRWQIIKGKSESEIRASWEPALGQFKLLRKKYLLYKDF